MELNALPHGHTSPRSGPAPCGLPEFPIHQIHRLMTTRSAFAAILSFTALHSMAGAAMVAHFDNTNLPDSGATAIPPMDWADNMQEPTGIAPNTGSGVFRVDGTNNAFFRGWSTTIDFNNYVGFQISAEPDHELQLTDIVFRTSTITGPAARVASSFTWGYRLDEGSGFGSWVMGKTYTSADPGFFNRLTENIWDFADFTTTGTVEFAFFGTAPSVNAQLEHSGVTVNGSVVPVPEPSSSLLVAAAGFLSFIRRRR